MFLKTMKRILFLLAVALLPAAPLLAEEPADEVQKRRAAALKKLAEAQKRQQALAAAQQQAAVVRLANSRGYVIPKEVNRDDPAARFLLLAPKTPLVIEADVTVNGKPFREAREKLVDELMKLADADGDGKAKWSDALQNPRFGFGRLASLNQAQRDQYTRTFDNDSDGLVGRAEARMLIAYYFQGPALMVSSGAATGYAYTANGRVYRMGGAGSPDVRKLLDADKDGELSVQEISAAGEKLKGRDADDNDVLEAAEAGGTVASPYYRGGNVRSGSSGNVTLSFLLGRTADKKAIFAALKKKYGDKVGNLSEGGFSLQGLFEALDKNKNKNIEEGEVAAFNSMKPHVKLTVDFEQTKGTRRMAITSVAPQIAKAKQDVANGSTALGVLGVKIAFNAAAPARTTYNYAATAKRYIERYDTNKNGYLDEKELAGTLARQFALWDINGDGKVYEDEIAKAYGRQWEPMMSQVRVSVSSDGTSLFKALDASGDGRLSLREMRSAPARLESFDKDGDGRIASTEIPVTYTVTFGQGSSRYGSFRQPVVRRGGGGVRPTNPATPARAPEWFVRMDRNGDGDVTPREFLGNAEQFKKVDKDGDGFIDAKEAAVIGGPAAQPQQATPQRGGGAGFF